MVELVVRLLSYQSLHAAYEGDDDDVDLDDNYYCFCVVLVVLVVDIFFVVSELLFLLS